VIRPKEALPDGWCPFSCGAHILFNIVANGIAECFATSRLLDGNRQIENSLPRSGIAVFVHTRDMAARCRNLGGMDWFVLDISFSRRTELLPKCQIQIPTCQSASIYPYTQAPSLRSRKQNGASKNYPPTRLLPIDQSKPEEKSLLPPSTASE
jgi:hypothetical protein